MEQLYLVTAEGERHEDHIPIGVYTEAKLLSEFPFIDTHILKVQGKNKWIWYSDEEVIVVLKIEIDSNIPRT